MIIPRPVRAHVSRGGRTGSPRTVVPSADGSAIAADDVTVEFCGNVLDEVMDIFPGPYVHLGGDE